MTTQQQKTSDTQKQSVPVAKDTFRLRLNEAVEKANDSLKNLSFLSEMTVGEKRLMRLASLLGTVNPQNFSMSTWGIFGTPHKFIRKRQLKESPSLMTNECGFAGCAMGWATQSGIFKDEGLRQLIPDKNACPVYGSAMDFNAAARFFDISYDEARRLFGPRERSPNTEANVIKKFVNNRVNKRVKQRRMK